MHSNTSILRGSRAKSKGTEAMASMHGLSVTGALVQAVPISFFTWQKINFNCKYLAPLHKQCFVFFLQDCFGIYKLVHRRGL